MSVETKPVLDSENRGFVLSAFGKFILRTRFGFYLPTMRTLAITIITFAAISAIMRGSPQHFVPKPTAPLPAINVP
jgi:hypothetical protein